MASRGPTQGERLTILETEARLRAESSDKAMEAVAKQLEKMNSRLETMELEQRATNARLAAYENKGKGVIFGAMLAGGGIVTAAAAVWDKLRGFFV